MYRYCLVVAAIVFAMLTGGCGGGSSSSGSAISGVTPIAFTTSDVAAGSFYLVSRGTIRTLTTPVITSTGALQLTDGTSTRTFVRFQSESTYWLVYDSSDTGATVYRLYTDSSAANTYYATISATLYQMGGAIQGGVATELTSANSNVSLFAGSLTATGATDASPATAATFNQPFGITAVGSYYYVVDNVNGIIRRISKTSPYAVTTLALVDSTSATVTLNHPRGITTDGTMLYVADTFNHVIRSIDISSPLSNGKYLTTIIAGNSSYSAGSVDSDTGTSAYFNLPTGITTDGTNLYVADSGNYTVRKIQIASNHVVRTIAGEAGKVGSEDGTYTDARFNTPYQLTTDGSTLYVTDITNRIIRSVKIATGQTVTIAGNATSPSGHVDGAGTAAVFNSPSGITCDGTNLYVTDWQGVEGTYTGSSMDITQYFYTTIRKITLPTSSDSAYHVSTIAGGQNTSLPELALPGLGIAARFANPKGLVWDGQLASLYVTNGDYQTTVSGATFKSGDSENNCIFRITTP